MGKCMGRWVVMRQCSVKMQLWMVDVVERREEAEEEEEETWCRHTLCWQEAVAQWLPGNDKGKFMARACRDVEESPGVTASRDAVCGRRCRFQRIWSFFAEGIERNRGNHARSYTCKLARVATSPRWLYHYSLPCFGCMRIKLGKSKDIAGKRQTERS